MDTETEKTKLGNVLRSIVRDRQEKMAVEAEKARKHREEPFIDVAEDFLGRLPQALQQAAGNGEDVVILDFVNLLAYREAEFAELRVQSSERHATPYNEAFRQLAQEIHDHCLKGGGLKLIQEFCKREEIGFEPQLSINGVEQAMISVKFTWRVVQDEEC